MSIQDITEYVRKTPGNSNPAVIKSMVESQVTEHVKEAAELATTMVKHDLGIREENFEPIVVIPNGNYEFDQGEYAAEITQCPEAGDAIKLNLDGVVYSGTAKEGLHGDDLVIYIGNGAILGANNTGETYLVAFMCNVATCVVVLFEETESDANVIHTIEVSFVASPVITPIDPKYIPRSDSGLTVVELETQINMQELITKLSDEDCQKLNEVVPTKCPIIINMNFGGFVKSSAAYSYADAMGMNVYGGIVGVGEGIYKVQVFQNDDAWQVALGTSGLN